MREIGKLQGKLPTIGKIIHGNQLKTKKVIVANYLNQAQKTITELQDLMASGDEPEISLKKHCNTCEYRQTCREKAEAKDHLSLLGGISQKEIRRLNNKGIFTVTQLSYTFRPRKPKKLGATPQRPHSFALQSLAIREKRIHVYDIPQLKLVPTRVYLDVEADLINKFYYLIGLVIDNNGSLEEHSLWADDKVSV